MLSLMSGATRRGRWRLSPRYTVVNVMGSSELDLNDVDELASNVTEMTVFSLMGGSDARVPDDFRVEVTDLALMGGNDIERGVTVAGRPDGPLLRLRLISIVGGANVTCGRRLSRAQRRARRAGLPPPPPPRG